MINVTRGPRPLSLDRLEIRTYLDQVIFYNELSEEEKKIATKPNAGEYRNADVLEAFDRDFHSKCYLTEQKYVNSWAMDIEHFKSKSFSQSPELKYEWSNLYPCSHDANMSKPKSDPEGGYLDPCNEADDVEKEIVYTLGFGGKAFFDPLNETNIKAKNTVLLLDKIHNGVDKDSVKKAKTLQLLINQKLEEVIDLIIDWLAAGKNGNKEEEVRLSRQIKNLLSRKSHFTMLLRSHKYVKKHIPVDFLD